MSTLDPELEYLTPGFDPSTLVVPKLRSILVAHNVPYPSSAKKADLIALFNEHVAPQARQLLNARSRTKRSTRGIQDVPSSQDSTVADDGEEPGEEPAPLPVRTPRSTRRSTRASTVESLDVATEPTSLANRTAKRISSKPSRQVAAEVDLPTTTRRARPSGAPSVKLAEPEPPTWHTADVENPFTQDNPFQSGSSPPAEARSTSRDHRRRTTMGHSETKERRKSRDGRRKTDEYNSLKLGDTIRVPPSDFTDRRYSRPKETKLEPVSQFEADVVEAGEEFTPEEQLALVRERAKNGEKDILPPRPKRKPQQNKGLTKTAFGGFLLASLLGFGAVWTQEKRQVGYCGVGRPSTDLIGGVQIPEWADFLRPECEPCPQHAYCYADMRTECESDFVLKHHPLSLNGLLPIPPTCEPDGEKARKVKAVADRGIEMLRQRNADYECGMPDEQGNPVTTPAMEEETLKAKVSSSRRKNMSQQEFDELWKAAGVEIESRDEVVVKVDPDTSARVLQSLSLSRIPYTCAVRRHVRLALARHIGKLVSAFLVPLCLIVARAQFRARRAASITAKELAAYALDRLATQAALHAKNPGAYVDKGITMTGLRDDVLRNEFSAKRREQLWKAVQKKVEANANVRSVVRESEHGDVGRVWEWVGPIGLLEGAPPGVNSPGAEGAAATGVVSEVPAKVKREIGDVRQWEEGHPIY